MVAPSPFFDPRMMRLVASMVVVLLITMTLASVDSNADSSAKKAFVATNDPEVLFGPNEPTSTLNSPLCTQALNPGACMGPGCVISQNNSSKGWETVLNATERWDLALRFLNIDQTPTLLSCNQNLGLHQL